MLRLQRFHRSVQMCLPFGGDDNVLGKRGGIENLDLLLLAIAVLENEGNRLTAPAVAQKVDAQVGGQPVKPCGKGGLEFKFIQIVPRLEKNFLRQIRGVLRMVRHAESQAVDLRLILQHELFKGIRIAGDCLFYALVFVDAPHLKSRLIAFTTAQTSSIVESLEI